MHIMLGIKSLIKKSIASCQTTKPVANMRTLMPILFSVNQIGWRTIIPCHNLAWMMVAATQHMRTNRLLTACQHNAWQPMICHKVSNQCPQFFFSCSHKHIVGRPLLWEACIVRRQTQTLLFCISQSFG